MLRSRRRLSNQMVLLVDYVLPEEVAVIAQRIQLVVSQKPKVVLFQTLRLLAHHSLADVLRLRDYLPQQYENRREPLLPVNDVQTL